MKEPKEVVQLNTSPGLGLALAVTVAAVILIGILPGKVLGHREIVRQGPGKTKDKSG